MARTIVDARHSGGFLIVEATVGDQGHRESVLLTCPGYELLLQPDEARRLAVALLAGAAEAERPPVDDWPDVSVAVGRG